MAVNPGLGEVTAAVNEQVVNANTRSDNAVQNTTSFIGALRDVAMTNPPATGLSLPGNVSVNVPGISANSPARPTGNIEAIKARVAQSPPSSFATTPVVTNFPTVDEKEITLPDVDLPDAPTFTTEVSADKPFIADVVNANAPTESVPSKLTSIGSYTIPAPPAVEIADFGDPLPAYTLEVPTTQFAYVEPTYSSALKDALALKLKSDVENGGTGLSEEVEDAIWERTRERDNKDYEEASTKVDSKWSERGFSLADGVLTELQRDLIVDDRNQRQERSRDILIKQAELAQVNTHFAITSSLSLEQLELNHANQIYNRALEAEKATIEFGIAYHNLKIADFNIQLQRHQSQAVEQGSRLEAEKVRLEAYRVELLEAEAKSNLDKDLLAEYNLDLERYDKLLKLFTAEQGAVATALGIEGLKIDFYKENINDHKARIDAQGKQAELYLAQVEGELGKVKLYSAELEAERTRVATLKVQADIELAKMRENIELQSLSLRAFLGNVEKYKAEVGVATSELELEGKMYGHDIDKFRTEVQKDVSQLSLGVETLIKGRALDLQNTNIRLENAKANLQSVLSTANLRLEAAKGIASSYVSIASAVMSGFTAIASIESGGLSSENEEL